MIDDCIDKMSKNDPTKHSQIANEKTIFDYMKWQILQIRNNVIERSQINDENSDDKKKNVYSRDEMIDMMNNGVFEK